MKISQEQISLKISNFPSRCNLESIDVTCNEINSCRRHLINDLEGASSRLDFHWTSKLIHRRFVVYYNITLYRNTSRCCPINIPDYTGNALYANERILRRWETIEPGEDNGDNVRDVPRYHADPPLLCPLALCQQILPDFVYLLTNFGDNTRSNY